MGWKNSGKTGFVVRLVDELVSRRFDVMTIKHGHGFRVDEPGTDSWRHRREGGATRVVLAGPDELAVMGGWGAEGELSPEEIATRFLPDADLVVAEGYKGSPLPKIEVHRTSLRSRPIYSSGHASAESFLAVVSDVEALDGPAPLLHPESPGLVRRVADLVEEEILHPARGLAAIDEVAAG